MYDYLYRQIFSNRWLVWFMVISVGVSIALLGYIQHSFVEMENLSSGNAFVSAHKKDSIKIRRPSAHEVIKSPFNVLGEARGDWFFAGDFPVKLIDGGGNTIRVAIAKAQGDSATEEFVPFLVRIDFDVEETIDGAIVFQKDNPTGRPENDFEFVLPVVFSAD